MAAYGPLKVTRTSYGWCDAGTKFVPATPNWAEVDAQAVLPDLLQKVAAAGEDVDTVAKAAADDMNAAFGS